MPPPPQQSHFFQVQQGFPSQQRQQQLRQAVFKVSSSDGVTQRQVSKAFGNEGQQSFLPTVTEVTDEYPKIMNLCNKLADCPSFAKAWPIVLEFLKPLLREKIHQKFLLNLIKTALTPLTKKEVEDLSKIGQVFQTQLRQQRGQKHIKVTIPTKWDRTDKPKVLKAKSMFDHAMQYLFIELVNKSNYQILDKKKKEMNLDDIDFNTVYPLKQDTFQTTLHQSVNITSLLTANPMADLMKTFRRFLSLWKRDYAPLHIGNPLDVKWYDLPGNLSSLYAYLVTNPHQKNKYITGSLQQQVRGTGQEKQNKERTMLMEDIENLIKKMEQTEEKKTLNTRYQRLLHQDETSLPPVKELLKDVSKAVLKKQQKKTKQQKQ